MDTTRRAEVWLLREADVDGFARPAAAMLSPDEWARWERLRIESARRRYLGARLLSRSVLAAQVGIAPSRLTFSSGEYGRPELHPNPWRLRFNLTHSEGLIACVVTADVLCGIDAERTPAAPAVVRYGTERFAPVERARLGAVEPGVRAVEFVDTWVLKEAYTKALGFGFQYGFDTFTLMPDARGDVVVNDPRMAASEAGHWRFTLFTAFTGHRLALALRHSEPVAGRVQVPVRAFPRGEVLHAVPVSV
ncbi:4'-phosphopantetheinyl transferase family protein [Glycomyces xiaoerkulensis]|uniref:4'-phosphopantetheinyl transferase family protein n=1 Tax=Glycomyces xiaoerkulensis TaxID=2038139 RepID=UPI000C25B69D|nr:4'-phosphopantetheinyl transferase superfamily protein [Glycomyces xiaoerkulensis]